MLINYCDRDCDKRANRLPEFQAVPNVVFAGQAIGAYPVMQADSGLGIVMDTPVGGVRAPVTSLRTNEHVYLVAPTAGMTAGPAPLGFTAPVTIATNGSAADGLPAAAVDRQTGTISAVGPTTATTTRTTS